VHPTVRGTEAVTSGLASEAAERRLGNVHTVHASRATPGSGTPRSGRPGAGRLPTFLVIGAMKSGTSSLSRYVRSHPDSFCSAKKEPEFFSMHWKLGIDWYRSLFADAGEAVAVGEFSTGYTKAPRYSEVAERVASVVPDVRIVYLVRDPVQRIRSQYIHQVAKEREHRSFDEAIRTPPSQYLDWSRYAYQLEPYVRLFPREQLLVLRAEDLRDRRDTAVAQVFEFLGLDPTFVVPDLDEEYNQSSTRRRNEVTVSRISRALRKAGVRSLIPRTVRDRVRHRMATAITPPAVSPETAAWIWHELGPDLDRLQQLLGPDFEMWPRPVSD
jgi:Sulfotransferase domain